jgi:hypothetical protein|tara:strand:+ start:4212 stop:4319 length:108 start_codon:yes stop_codon:yes gene_type:complete
MEATTKAVGEFFVLREDEQMDDELGAARRVVRQQA